MLSPDHAPMGLNFFSRNEIGTGSSPVRRSLAAEAVVREPVALVALQREFYREAGGEG